MLITNLNLTNYRSYSTLDLELTGGVSVFIGKNGEGKTNIAESILYLTFLNSHRASGNTPLIKLGNQAAYIRAKVKYPEREILVELEINALHNSKYFFLASNWILIYFCSVSFFCINF